MPDKSTLPPLFSQVDVTTGGPTPARGSDHEHGQLLRDVLTAQDRTNELLEELIGLMTAQQRSRRDELQRWRDANPELADSCREAAETLSGVQSDFLGRMTDDVRDMSDDFAYGEFTLNEFVDRYGPRLAHLNGVVQALAQLGGAPTSAAEADLDEE